MSPKKAGERLLWLDIVRFSSALLILGIHWLRACYKVGLYGRGSSTVMVMDYQSHSGGVHMLPYVLIAGTAPTLGTWLANVVGVFGEFGWEAVSALIMVSGFSLVVAQRGRRLTLAEWFGWYRKRAKRILAPFYIVAAVFLALYGVAALALPRIGGHAAGAIDAKLLSQFHSPPLGVVLSHVILLDPYQRQWIGDFFAPAWWFVPAILLAYAAYPMLRRISWIRGGWPLLAAAALLSILSFAAADAGVLVNEAWYYIVLQESFNFCLGIVAGNLWLGPQRSALERLLRDRRALGLGAALFVLGNLANWSNTFRPVASMLYGPGLVLVLAFIATRIESQRWIPAAIRIDAYDLYLVHQPFAFPIALVAGAALGGYAVFVGWFVFVAIAAGAAAALARVRVFALATPNDTRAGLVRRPLRREKATS